MRSWPKLQMLYGERIQMPHHLGIAPYTDGLDDRVHPSSLEDPTHSGVATSRGRFEKDTWRMTRSTPSISIPLNKSGSLTTLIAKFLSLTWENSNSLMTNLLTFVSLYTVQHSRKNSNLSLSISTGTTMVLLISSIKLPAIKLPSTYKEQWMRSCVVLSP